MKNSRNNVFRSKQTKNTVPRKIYRGCEVRRKLRLMFWVPKNSMKGKCHVFSGSKQRNKVCLVYLECKLQQDTYGWCIFKLKRQKKVETTYLETEKQETTYRWCFQIVKGLRKGNNCMFGLSQQRSKVQCMSLAFENLKIGTKEGQYWSESQKQSTNDVFWG